MFKVASLRNPFSTCSGGEGESVNGSLTDQIVMEDTCMVSIPSSCGSGAIVEDDNTRTYPASCNAFNPCDAAMCEGEAMDVILIQGSEPPPSNYGNSSNNNTIISSSDFYVRFPRPENVVCELQLLPDDCDSPGKNSNGINDTSTYTMRNSRSCWTLDEIMKPRKNGVNNNNSSENFVFSNSSSKPSQTALQQLASQCKPGKNIARYALYSKNVTTIENEKQQPRSICGSATLHIYLWNYNDRIVVSDVDGTITKSNARGIMDTIVLERYAYVHDGICQFWQQFLLAQQQCTATAATTPLTTEGQLRMLYLTSRPMSLVHSTRQFLCQLRQGSHSLPEGPLFCNLQHTHQVLLSELVYKDVAGIKADILVRQVVLPFAAARADATRTREDTMSGTEETPSSLQQQPHIFFAGFGNTTADCQAYEMAGMHRHDIYMIDKSSKIVCIDKVDHHQQHQLASLKKRISSVRIPSKSPLPTNVSPTATTTTSTKSTVKSTSRCESGGCHHNNGDNCNNNNRSEHKELDPHDDQPFFSSSTNDDKNNTTTVDNLQKFQLLAPARRKRSYKKLFGTSFNGYKDARLITCLQAKLER